MIDSNQGNPFICYPSPLCNKSDDKTVSVTSDLFPTPSSDPFSDDPFSPLNDQSDSMFSSNNKSDLSSFLLNGPDLQQSLSEYSSPNNQLFNGLSGAQLSHESPNTQVNQLSLSNLNGDRNFLFSQNPFLSTSMNNPPILNGLARSGPPVLQTPLLCNGSSKSVALFQTIPPPSVQNGGLMVLCPPPQSSKSGCMRRRGKVNIWQEKLLTEFSICINSHTKYERDYKDYKARFGISANNFNQYFKNDLKKDSTHLVLKCKDVLTLSKCIES